MERIKRKSAVVVITGILLLAALSTGIASAENGNLSVQITPEGLLELLSGGWDFNGTITIGEYTMPIIGTRTVILTGPTTADFVAIMEGEEEAETGEAWWDADREQFVVKEEEEEPTYCDLLPDGYGATYELEGGIPELGITEKVFCEMNETFVDENTSVHIWIARNATGVVLAEWEGTYNRTNVWHVVEGISIQDAIDNAADGDTVIVHEGIYEEQLYIVKSLDLKAAEGESPKIWAPEPETLESYGYDYDMFPGWTMLLSVTPLIMVNGSSDDINVNISGFIINGSSVTPENSEYGITGILYYNADGIIEDNEIKNIWGVKEEEGEPPYPWNGNGVFALSESNIVIHRNNIHNYTGVESCGILIFGIGLAKNPFEAMVTKNIVTGARSPESPDQMGISIYDAIVTVNDNIVSGHIYTEDMWYASGMSIIDTNLTAQGNTLIGGGILVNTGAGYPHSTAFIKNNTVDVSGVHEEECGPFAGVAITTYPPVFAAYDPSVNATVEANQFIGGPGSGIVIGGIGAGSGVEPVGSVNAMIARNTVSGWDYGIELLKCSISTVYLNDFANNTQSVVVNESENTYNSTTEFGYLYGGEEYTNYLGNYWSDYEGTDEDEDGIGDSPYNITGDNPDYYPLMQGFENYSLVTQVYEGESIQEAIDNASEGGTVIVHEGIYEEQLYIAKSLDLKAAEGDSPEIRAPAPETMESFDYDFSPVPGFITPRTVTPVIMVNGSSGDISVDISGFVIDGSPVTPENSEYGIMGIAYFNADGTVEYNEIKNIWGEKAEMGEHELPLPFNGVSIYVLFDSDVTVHGNTVHNYTGVESRGINIHCAGAKGTITENTVIGARSAEFPDQCGILVSMGATWATVNDNIVSGHIYHEGWTYAPGIAFCEAVNGSAQGNTLIDNQVGIWAEVGGTKPNSTVSFADNIVNASGLSEVTPCGIALTTCWPFSPIYEGEPTITATVEGNQLIGGSGTGITVGDTWCWMPEHYPGFGTVTATITRNIVTDWDYGIKLLNCSNSVVYLNDFVNNTQNVFVNESTNVYSSPGKIDYTYKGRDYTNYVGNYWSNYEGGDADADGIGDTSYGITGDNPDSYPLMERNEKYEQIGILVVAHGSPSESWCKPVREVVENVSTGYPTEVGYLEFVGELEGYNFIHEAVDKLDEQGVTKIIAVPLFISSHSGHISEIEYVLGLRETLPEMGVMSSTRRETMPGTNIISSTRTFVDGVEMERSIISREGRYYISYTPISDGVSAKQHGGEEEELVQVDTTAEIVLTNAIDEHSLIAQILADRAAEVCENPENETVVIVGHGTDEEECFPGWVNSSESLAEKVNLMLRHSKGIDIEDVRYSFVYPPEDYPVNLTVRAVVENVSSTSYPVVVPLMVSEGFFTNVYIPSMLLAGLDYTYPDKGKRALTPHDNVANWVEVTAAKEFVYPAVLIYDEEELQEISLAEVGAHHDEICPCVAFAFRSTLRAFSDEELWDGIPRRGDVKIISANPSDGHNMAYEYILNSTEDVMIELPPGTDIINITTDNFVYTFINKSIGESVTLRVKEDIFPERFFELRTKKKLGTATPEEKKAFELLWEKLKEKAMYKPVDRVFEEVEPGTCFETGEGAYPSIFGTHYGEIIPDQNVTVNTIYTYPCTGTGGHTKSAVIWNETTGDCAVAEWDGYIGDYHNLSFNLTLTLQEGIIYSYIIKTGSYPQIIHAPYKHVNGGNITCTEFVDANGKVYHDWIPAIRLLYG